MAEGVAFSMIDSNSMQIYKAACPWVVAVRALVRTLLEVPRLSKSRSFRELAPRAMATTPLIQKSPSMQAANGASGAVLSHEKPGSLSSSRQWCMTTELRKGSEVRRKKKRRREG